MLLYPLLIHVNVVIIIYLGWIYSCHVSSKEWTQRCCFDFNTEGANLDVFNEVSVHVHMFYD